jgi:hypothetical protein
MGEIVFVIVEKVAQMLSSWYLKLKDFCFVVIGKICGEIIVKT